ncbi:ABC transporter substrate-binding protein [Agrobacterium vitis]|uniref:ABC transporter substrate-binding protein n=1 Tax=Agrobacterium vitis TaxID=373 RepID=A0A368NVA2_AGRVI|nr:ABC transporter substrate-binding protein [Agrobacterium vitis]KAA3526718.1 ABC transporter substrate-binding protein [Agrobacterium vitis]MCF1479380.1 ABC transporter substrate-binding protein [Agrobacterium vitis]MUZ98043.1 ABC transporter substrate-binding protein [Agrobacterium vitis]MVA28685.1 ABC transporter substrate-binding protein [Agrobacterium vitis]
MISRGNGLRRLLSTLLVLPFCGLFAASATLAEPVNAISMYGKPALPADYKHLPYVNPDVKKGGRISYGVVGTFDSFNPFVIKGMRTTARGIWDPEYGNLFYETLMTRSAGEPYTLYGLLAQSVEWDDARSFIQFNLNPKARWQDGQPVTPDDVIFTLQILQQKGRAPFDKRLNGVARMEKVGEHSVRFTFNDKADREIPLLLAYATPILPKHAIDPDLFEQSSLNVPVGSGPYKIKDIRPGERITYQRDPNYWGKDLPSKVGFDNYDEVSVTYFLQDSTLFEAFKKGEIDIYPDGDSAHWLRAYNFPAAVNGDVVRETFTPQKPTGMLGFVFNTRRPIFADVKVREALTLAFDFEWVNKNIYGNAFKRIQSYWQNSPLGAFGHAADDRELAILGNARNTIAPEILAGTYTLPISDGSGADRNILRQAVALLSQAGYSINDGKMVDAQGKPLSFEVMTQNAGQEKMALAYQRTLRLIGIGMTIRTVDDAQYQARSNSFDYDMVVMAYPSTLAPGIEQFNRWGSTARDRQSSFNYAGVANPDIDRVLNTMVNARSLEDYQASVRALDRLLVAGHYVVPLYYNGEQWLARWKRIARPDQVPMLGYQLPTWWDARAQ